LRLGGLEARVTATRGEAGLLQGPAPPLLFSEIDLDPKAKSD